VSKIDSIVDEKLTTHRSLAEGPLIGYGADESGGEKLVHSSGGMVLSRAA
jgi:hypothetical protein